MSRGRVVNTRFVDARTRREEGDALRRIDMRDRNYGWTVEMQLKALKKQLAYTEVPVRYKKRIGVSKVSGTVKGTIFAGIKILGWIFKYSFR